MLCRGLCSEEAKQTTLKTACYTDTGTPASIQPQKMSLSSNLGEIWRREFRVRLFICFGLVFPRGKITQKFKLHIMLPVSPSTALEEILILAQRPVWHYFPQAKRVLRSPPTLSNRVPNWSSTTLDWACSSLLLSSFPQVLSAKFYPRFLQVDPSLKAKDMGQ